jgi:DNA modification methylase
MPRPAKGTSGRQDSIRRRYTQEHSPRETLGGLLAQFHTRRRPIPVSFRELLGPVARAETATHGIHPYPAKLLAHIPRFILQADLAHERDLVFDPFCGSGTVLLEGILSGRDVAGADANPLARLISRVKLTPIESSALRRHASRLFRRLDEVPRGAVPPILNANYWFYPHVQRDLHRLYQTVSRTQDENIRNFLLIALSATLKEVSLADPRLTVPVRLRADQYHRSHWLYTGTQARLRKLRRINTVESFRLRLDSNLNQMENYVRSSRNGRLIGLAECARGASLLDDSSVGLVVTSPPYLGAQKYIRSSSLSLTLLGLCQPSRLRAVESLNIGREHFRMSEYNEPLRTGHARADKLIKSVRERDPLRAHIASVYLTEMREALRELIRVLKPGGHAVLVLGASHLRGHLFDTPNYIRDLACALGLKHDLTLIDPIRSRALMTKRHHTAGQIDTEVVMIFRK